MPLTARLSPPRYQHPLVGLMAGTPTCAGGSPEVLEESTFVIQLPRCVVDAAPPIGLHSGFKNTGLIIMSGGFNLGRRHDGYLRAPGE